MYYVCSGRQRIRIVLLQRRYSTAHRRQPCGCAQRLSIRCGRPNDMYSDGDESLRSHFLILLKVEVVVCSRHGVSCTCTYAYVMTQAHSHRDTGSHHCSPLQSWFIFAVLYYYREHIDPFVTENAVPNASLGSRRRLNEQENEPTREQAGCWPSRKGAIRTKTASSAGSTPRVRVRLMNARQVDNERMRDARTPTASALGE